MPKHTCYYRIITLKTTKFSWLGSHRIECLCSPHQIHWLLSALTINNMHSQQKKTLLLRFGGKRYYTSEVYYPSRLLSILNAGMKNAVGKNNITNCQVSLSDAKGSG